MLKHKGTWSVTETGLAAFTKWTDPEAFYKEAVRLYNIWKKGQAGAQDAPPAIVPDAEGEEAEKSTSITFEQAEEQAWAEIDDT